MMGPALTKAHAAALRLECAGLATQCTLRRMLMLDPEEATTACGEVGEKQGSYRSPNSLACRRIWLASETMSSSRRPPPESGWPPTTTATISMYELGEAQPNPHRPRE